MDYTEYIIDLYRRVYEKEKSKFGVNGNSIKAAIQVMKETYLPNPRWRSDIVSKTANFNQPADRCAYLHKYAMVHTGLVCQILQMFFQQSDVLRDLISKSHLNICSLGGGPGTDVVSLLFILSEVLNSKKCSVTVIDYFDKWSEVFESIVAELKTGRYGSVNNMLSFWSFDSQYLSVDLLNMSKLTAYRVLQTVKNADIITMVKFISAVACDKTNFMVQKIFENMKVGAIVLFVDNAAGGFDKMVRNVAYECGMQSIFGPLQHYEYDNPAFRLQRLGYTSQSKTKVCVEVWKKTFQPVYNTTQQPRNENSYNSTQLPQHEYIYNTTQQQRRNNIYTSQQLRREYVYGPSRRENNAYSSQNIRLGERRRKEEGCCSII